MAAAEGSVGPPAGISSQELLQEMKAFISGMDPSHGHKLTVKEHARCGLLLLRNLPPARGAVLEHLRGVFDEYVSGYILELNREGGGAGPLGRPGLDDVTQEIQGVLSEFVRSNPAAWAPLVSAWSIELMGQLSSKYSGRHPVPHAGSLNELLQLWMSCKATRALMEIYVQCLSAMIGSCPDACVDALLDTSVQHSPHFDWVVAHIGSSFPNTIISRVLSCGLKDFCMHEASSSSSSSCSGGPSMPDPLFPSPADKRVPKIASVVGILGHLATRHSASIRQELLLMFHQSLGPCREPQGPAAVPFLLQLAAMSPALLGAVSAELIDSLTPPVLEQLRQRLAGLGRDEGDNLAGLAVHLICQTGPGAERTLRFLLGAAGPASVIAGPGPASAAAPDGVRRCCQRLVQLLLLQLQRLVYERPAGQPQPQARAVPFLDALGGRVRELCAETLRLERERQLWQHQLLGLLCVYGGPSLGAEALCQLLVLAGSPEELGLVARLYGGLAGSVPRLLPAAVCRCVARLHSGPELPPGQAGRLLANLAGLAGWEGPEGGGAPLGPRLARALSAHVRPLGRLLAHPHSGVSRSAARLLAAVPLPPSLGPAHLAGLVRAATGHFFLALGRQGPSSSALADSCRLLARLSTVSPGAARCVLRQLVRSALHPGNARLFGGGPSAPCSPAAPAPATPGDSLLHVNRSHGTAVNFAGSVWAVFHAGVIGRGLKPAGGSGRGPGPEEADANVYRLLGLVVRCGAALCPPASTLPCPTLPPEAAKAVALALVEGLCPEVTDSDLDWPPAEHARHTVERDLRVCRYFQEQPLLLGLLRLVSLGPPALCYCSVLLRALLATLAAHWEASRHGHTTASPWPLHASRQLLACMAEGQLLPPALANAHELFHLLTPFEVRLLLLSVWDYVRDNGPQPHRFSFDPERGSFRRDFSRDGELGKYLGVLHSVLHKNIDRLGHLYGRFQL
uniref:integrator complex subunit 5 n=1 Tax=Pristiophorus japonicus TaxID=55135 RepID=UPI00398F0DAE